MNKYLTVCLFVLFSFISQAQHTNNPLKIINEARILLNYSHSTNPNVNGDFEYGLGIYRAAFHEKRTNLIVGIEYNRSNQKADKRSIGYEHTLKNIDYTFHTLNLPIALRLNFGKTYKVFTELGPQFNLNLNLMEEGTKMRLGEEIGDYKSKSNTYANISALGALGVIVPVKNKEILFRAAYTYNFSNYDIGFKQDWLMPNHYASFGIGLKW